MALTETEITSITNRYIVPKVADAIYGSNPLVKRASQPGKLMLVDGGHQIVCPINHAIPSTSGGYYTGDETQNTSQTSDMTAAVYDWKELYQSIRIPRIDFLKNQSDLGKLNLVAEKFKVGQSNMLNNLALGMLSDGTVSTGAGTTKQLNGLQSIMSASATHGGIAVADLAAWIPYISSAASNRPISLSLLQSAQNFSRYDNEGITVFVCDRAVENEIWALFQPFQRIMSSSMAKLGFTSILEANGVPVLGQQVGMPANTVYGINENMVKLAVHPKENMRVASIENLESSNSMLKKIYWTGNLICHSRRHNCSITQVQSATAA